jgi:hypothetical protein
MVKSLLLPVAVICLMVGCAKPAPDSGTVYHYPEVSAPTAEPAIAQPSLIPVGPPPAFVGVGGHFVNPGRYPWTNGMTLKYGIAAAGGFDEFASRRIRIFHWDGTEERYHLGKGLSLSNNPVLKPGDSVVNPTVEW